MLFRMDRKRRSVFKNVFEKYRKLNCLRNAHVQNRFPSVHVSNGHLGIEADLCKFHFVIT